ncbi:Carboxypeptidase 2 [Paramyrothecium foliicola]|nr:Carboxypeptidase 2 [Paramyrothecium foliicola]
MARDVLRLTAEAAEMGNLPAAVLKGARGPRFELDNMIHGVSSMAQRVCAAAIFASAVTAQSGGVQTGLRYGENWVPTVKDSRLVAANFPDVNITLRSPAFLKPETVPARFSNGTEGPTDDIELDYFIRNLAQKNEWLTYESAAFLSEEGRAIPYLFLSLPDSGNQTEKLRVYLQAAIHGNEPAADQSVLAFLGKLDAEPSWARSLLEKMDIKVLPRYNVDGVAYFQRQLASNLDPNREHIKLMRGQSKGIKRIVSEWNPHLALDMHEFTAPTIYGGHYQHGSDALLSGGINPNIHPAIREQLLDVFIPAVGERLESYGLRWEPYVTGASNRTAGSRIRFTEAVTEARTGRNAVGLTQTISFLLEMRGIRLADQHFQRRVATALIKIQAILELARDNAGDVKSIVEEAREEFINSDEDIVITDSYVPENRTFTMVDTRNGSVVQVPIDFQRTTPSVANLTRARPEAYIIPRTWIDVAERLEILGVEVQRLEHEFVGTVEALTIASSVVDPEMYEGHYLNTVTTSSSSREIVLPVGSFYVSTRQQNAALAFIALEPENIDSYVTFNIIPVSEGEEYPVFRIPRE